jgi:hypothetical protein
VAVGGSFTVKVSKKTMSIFLIIDVQLHMDVVYEFLFYFAFLALLKESPLKKSQKNNQEGTQIDFFFFEMG